MQIGVTIRLVKIEDAADLHQNCFPAVPTVEAVREGIEEDLGAFADGLRVPLVAEVDGSVVGTATLLRESHRLKRHRAEVGGVVVAGRYQGRGIGRRLIDELRSRAAAMGVEILEISWRGGTRAEELYRRLGFVEYGRLPSGLKEPSGQAFDHVLFYMPIGPTADAAVPGTAP